MRIYDNLEPTFSAFLTSLLVLSASKLLPNMLLSLLLAHAETFPQIIHTEIISNSRYVKGSSWYKKDLGKERYKAEHTSVRHP